MRETQIQKSIALTLLAALALTACQSMYQSAADNPNTTTGGAIGAASGGLIAAAAGGDAGGIVGGMLLGGLLGGAIGNALDQKDKELAMKNAEMSMETSRTGQTTEWRNPDTGHSGTITPTRTYQDAAGQNCREFQQIITVGGKQEEAYGVACRDPDGSWRIVD
jgi:surface antigen